MFQHGQLITTNNLLTSLPDEIIDNAINDVKNYFTDHAWYEFLQRGISKYVMQRIVLLVFWYINKKNVNGPINYITMNMIHCDLCEEWYHRCIY